MSINDIEQARLRALADELYSPLCFVANVIWNKKYAPQNDALWLSDDHDFLYFCTHGTRNIATREIHLARASKTLPTRTRSNNTRGPWKAGDYTSNKSRAERPNLYYAIRNPNTGEETWPSEGRVWAYSKELHQQHAAESRIWWGRSGTNRIPSFKRFLTGVGGVVPRTLWSHEEVGHNQNAVRELQALFGVNSFSSPKPTGVIQRCSRIAGRGCIFDFFAGSGTTGHAVINLNREDGGERKYILVELGDYFDTVLNHACKKSFTPKIGRTANPSPGKVPATCSNISVSNPTRTP